MLCQNAAHPKDHHASPTSSPNALDRAFHEVQLLKVIQETQNIITRIGRVLPLSSDVQETTPISLDSTPRSPSLELSGNTFEANSHAIAQAVKTGLIAAIPDLLEVLLPSCIPIPPDILTAESQITSKPHLTGLEGGRSPHRAETFAGDGESFDSDQITSMSNLVTELETACKVLQRERHELEKLRKIRQGEYFEESRSTASENWEQVFTLREDLLSAIRAMYSDKQAVESVQEELQEARLRICELEMQLKTAVDTVKKLEVDSETKVAAFTDNERLHVSSADFASDAACVNSLAACRWLRSRHYKIFSAKKGQAGSTWRACFLKRMRITLRCGNSCWRLKIAYRPPDLEKLSSRGP